MPAKKPEAKPMVERSDLERKADKAVEIACRQLATGIEFRQPRLKRIQEIEEMYSLKAKPALAGRFNIPFDGVIMRGFVDSLMAKIDDPPRIEFKNTKEASLKAARKITASADYELSSVRTNLAQKDRWGKKLGIISGRTTYKVFGESDPAFRFCVDNVDHYDFVTEPNGGGSLANHLFKYQQNIFRTKEELKRKAKGGFYNPGQVSRLINSLTPSDAKENDDAYRNKVTRFANIGLDAETNNYVGQKLFNLTEGVLVYEGEKFYIVFDAKQHIWIRFAPLKEVFESDLEPWVSWATDEDAFVFWSLGPADGIYPIADARRVNLNAMMNNQRKIADDMIVYDDRSITDPQKLIYAPDRIIAASLKDGKTLEQVVKRLAPNDISTLAINLDKFLNEFLGQHSGITPGAQGNATEDLATVYEGNLQQVADRIGLLNKSYALCHEEIGRRFDWGLWEHAPQDYMVKSIGPNGAEWEELTKEDKDPDFEVRAVSSSAEQRASQLKADKQEKALTAIVSNELLITQVSPKKVVEELLRFGEYDEEAIRVFLDTQNEGGQEILSEAARMITDCLEGKPLTLYRGATTAFVQKILDYATNTRLEEEKYHKLIALAEAHIPVMQENMVRKARMAQAAMPVQEKPAPEVPSETPLPA